MSVERGGIVRVEHGEGVWQEGREGCGEGV